MSAPTADPPPDARETYLTADELEALRLSGELANAIGRIIRPLASETAAQDWGEAAAKVHTIQHLIASQAAARAYPELFRPLGGAPLPTEAELAEQEAADLTAREARLREAWPLGATPLPFRIFPEQITLYEEELVGLLRTQARHRMQEAEEFQEAEARLRAGWPARWTRLPETLTVEQVVRFQAAVNTAPLDEGREPSWLGVELEVALNEVEAPPEPGPEDSLPFAAFGRRVLALRHEDADPTKCPVTYEASDGTFMICALPLPCEDHPSVGFEATHTYRSLHRAATGESHDWPDDTPVVIEGATETNSVKVRRVNGARASVNPLELRPVSIAWGDAMTLRMAFDAEADRYRAELAEPAEEPRIELADNRVTGRPIGRCLVCLRWVRTVAGVLEPRRIAVPHGEPDDADDICDGSGGGVTFPEPGRCVRCHYEVAAEGQLDGPPVAALHLFVGTSMTCTGSGATVLTTTPTAGRHALSPVGEVTHEPTPVVCAICGTHYASWAAAVGTECPGARS